MNYNAYPPYMGCANPAFAPAGNFALAPFGQPQGLRTIFGADAVDTRTTMQKLKDFGEEAPLLGVRNKFWALGVGGVAVVAALAHYRVI